MRMLAILLGMLFGLVASEAFADKVHTFRPGMFIGQGIDGVSGELKGACVDHPPPAAVAGGQTVSLSIERIDSSNELRKQLSLEVEASFTGVGGGKLDFKQKSEFSRFFKYVIASVEVDNSQTILTLNQTRLSDSARALLEAGDLDRFTERCGTAFLFSVNTGGEFLALYRFVTRSNSEEEALETELSGGMGGFEASAAFKSKLESLAKTASFDINIFRDGDVGATEPQSPEEIIAYAVNFSKVIADPTKARNLSLVSIPYTVLDLPAFSRAMFDTSRFNNELSLITLRLDSYSDAITDLRFVIEHPNQFEGMDAAKRTELFAAIETFRAGQRALESRANHCLARKDPTCFTPGVGEAVPLAVETVLPQRKAADPLSEMVRKCRDTATSSAKIVILEPRGDHIYVLIRTASDAFKSHYVSQGIVGNKNSPFFWSRPKAGRFDGKEIDANCIAYKDLDVRSGRVCYAVTKRGASRTSIPPTSDKGDVACLDLP